MNRRQFIQHTATASLVMALPLVSVGADRKINLAIQFTGRQWYLAVALAGVAGCGRSESNVAGAEAEIERTGFVAH